MTENIAADSGKTISQVIPPIALIVGANLPVAGIILANKLKHGFWYLFGINIGLIVLDFVLFFYQNFEVFIILLISIISISIFSFFLINAKKNELTIKGEKNSLILEVAQLSEDIKGQALAEKMIRDFNIFDTQNAYICFLMNRQKGNIVNNTDIRESIQKAIDLVLDSMDSTLQLMNGKEFTASILLVDRKYKFKLLADVGLGSKIIKGIDRAFQHGDNFKGIAGLCVKTGEPIYIPDITNETKYPEAKYWARVADQKRVGSIFCYPLFEGVGDDNNLSAIDDGENSPESDDVRCVIAVISLSSTEPYAFVDIEKALKFVELYSQKFESLIYLHRLVRNIE